MMSKDTAEIFSGIVEVDETYLGGQMKNRKQKDRWRAYTGLVAKGYVPSCQSWQKRIF